jgi:hypothetical protein
VPDAIYVRGDEPGEVVASELARGPWDPGAQHGGAPAALLTGALEALPAADGLQLARVTFELLRPVPLGPLRVAADVVRPGRRVQLLEATLSGAEGTELVRARAVRVAAASAPAAGEPGRTLPAPDTGRPNDLVAPFSPLFAPDAMEIRFIEGEFTARGPSAAWFRLRVPVIAGESVSPLQRLAAAADFGNGISAPVAWDDWIFINPDLTLYVERPPRGEWFCLDSHTVIGDGGIGLSESVLYDRHGRVGRATQSLLVAPR